MSARSRSSELPWLAGYEGSAPVRVGNGAVEQLPARRLRRGHGHAVAGPDVRPGPQRGRLAHAARPDELAGERLARQPDEGLWEVRGPRQHFTHSKVLAWVAADRAARTVENSGLDGPVDRWRALREEIHADVCAKGFDTDRGTFTQYYGSRGLDAATLLIPQVGFLPAGRRAGARHAASHPARALHRRWADPSVRRRRRGPGHRRGHGSVDGLPGDEGAFLACSSGWPTRWSWTAGSTRDARCSSGCSTCATTSACSPRSTTSRPGASSATCRRPTATSRWSTPR